ncbi:carbohydrate binding [Branchiostoma belcheri]|nr:carbohydrate binding [Branchiostoma belcheri]
MCQRSTIGRVQIRDGKNEEGRRSRSRRRRTTSGSSQPPEDTQHDPNANDRRRQQNDPVKKLRRLKVEVGRYQAEEQRRQDSRETRTQEHPTALQTGSNSTRAPNCQDNRSRPSKSKRKSNSILPCVPHEIKRKIWSGVYVELDTLLCIDDADPDDGKLSFVFDPKPYKYGECEFKTAYRSHLSRHMRRIHTAYDEKFRKSVVGNPTKRWDEVDVQLLTTCPTPILTIFRRTSGEFRGPGNILADLVRKHKNPTTEGHQVTAHSPQNTEKSLPNDLLQFSAAKKQLSLEQLKANLRQILEHPAPSNTPGTEQNEEVPRGESPSPRPDDADGTDDAVSHLKAAFTVKAVEARQRQEVPVQQDSRLAIAYEDSWYVGRVVEIHDSGQVASVLFLQRVSKRQKRMDREALLQGYALVIFTEDNALDVVPLRDIETDDPEVDEEYLTRFSGDQKYYTARVIEFSDNKAQLLKKVCDDITGKKKKQKKGAGGSKEKANNASKKSSRLRSIIATFRYRRQLDEYRAHGINLKQHMYVPEQVGGVYVHRREDHCHIPKRIASHLRGEPPRWLNHHALEEALHPVEGEPKTRLTEAALFGWRKQSVKEEPPVISCCHVPPSQRTDLRHRVMEFGPVDVAAVIRQASICEQARHAENLEEIEKLREEKREEGISAMEAELGKERAKNWRRYASDVKDYHVIPSLTHQGAAKVPISCTTFIPTFPQLSSVKEWEFDPNDDAVKQHDVMVTGRDRDALKELLKFKPQRRERLDRLGQLSQIEFYCGCRDHVPSLPTLHQIASGGRKVGTSCNSHPLVDAYEKLNEKSQGNKAPGIQDVGVGDIVAVAYDGILVPRGVPGTGQLSGRLPPDVRKRPLS